MVPSDYPNYFDRREVGDVFVVVIWVKPRLLMHMDHERPDSISAESPPSYGSLIIIIGALEFHENNRVLKNYTFSILPLFE